MPVPESDVDSDYGEDIGDNTQRQDSDRAVNYQGRVLEDHQGQGDNPNLMDSRSFQEISDSHKDSKLLIEVIEQKWNKEYISF